MSARYASGTSVSTEQTRTEIERTLTRYGADGFGYMLDGRDARIAFRMKGRHFRFNLTLPDPKAEEFHTYMQGSTRFRRAEGVPQKMWEQACRSRWRALLLVIKAKLEAVEVGITTLEDEFMSSMVLPNKETVGEWIRPQIEEAYRIGAMPQQLQIEGPAR